MLLGRFPDLGLAIKLLAKAVYLSLCTLTLSCDPIQLLLVTFDCDRSSRRLSLR